MASKLVGASVWEEQLYEHLTSHESSEREILVEYQQAAADSGSAAFQYLASLIVEDEIRHHRIFEELASALRTDAELRPEQPAIPRLDHWGPDPAHVVELTERLMERERQDAKAFDRLGRELKDVRDTTMWGLLIKLMEMDTAKHIEILEFVRRHARKSSAG
jgi:hypothetical protein